MNLRAVLRVVFPLVCLLGIGVATYLVTVHYEVSDASFCSISETFDCNTVNQSAYSELFGVSVSLIGAIGYLVMAILFLVYDKTRREDVFTALGVCVLVALGFSLYLTYIEAFVLYTWCLLCLASLLFVLVLTGSYFGIKHIDKR